MFVCFQLVFFGECSSTVVDFASVQSQGDAGSGGGSEGNPPDSGQRIKLDCVTFGAYLAQVLSGVTRDHQRNIVKLKTRDEMTRGASTFLDTCFPKRKRE